MGRLDNKVALITGAGAGVGRATAILFAKDGAKVVVADINADAGEETVSMIGQAGGEGKFVKADVSKTEDIRGAIQACLDTYGKLNILFNNAAIAEPVIETTVECTEENWDKVLAIDLKGLWLAMKYAIPEMLKTGGGSIINAASQAATRGNAGFPAYTAAKGGVVSLSKATAIEYADKNIRVNILEPGFISTPMVQPFLENPAMRKKVVEGTPQRRLGKPEEVAYAVLFLACDESSHITGAELAVDGGIVAWSRIG
jgi:NAD(P)-dependent dehydrogenase (short-subunit alcohol dehydrogenase family)